jgi:hypothetical protein
MDNAGNLRQGGDKVKRKGEKQEGPAKSDAPSTFKSLLEIHPQKR